MRLSDGFITRRMMMMMADLSECGGSVERLFAHPAAVLLLARTRATGGAFLLGCAGRGGTGSVCACVADGLSDVRAGRDGGGIGRGWRCGHGIGAGVGVVVMEGLGEEEGGPVAVLSGVVVDGRSVEEACKGIRMRMIVKLRLKGGELGSRDLLHTNGGDGMGGGGSHSTQGLNTSSSSLSLSLSCTSSKAN